MLILSLELLPFSVNIILTMHQALVNPLEIPDRVFFPVYQIDKHGANTHGQLHRLRMPTPAVDSSFHVLFEPYMYHTINFLTLPPNGNT